MKRMKDVELVKKFKEQNKIPENSRNNIPEPLSEI